MNGACGKMEEQIGTSGATGESTGLLACGCSVSREKKKFEVEMYHCVAGKGHQWSPKAREAEF